jgi:1-acyl-sn-glycerol-3-phosphate acyltransferase
MVATKAASRASSVAGDSERAGLSLTKSGVNNPNPIQHGGMGQAERAFSAASTFLSGVMAISASQFIGAPLKLVDPKFYEHYMAWTKESFAVLMTTITQWWSPTVVRVSGDESMKGQLFQMDDGSLKCNFPHRMVLMANHQLYTDWLYLWWIAYTNKMHGRIYIILKESLKQIPIFGWGAQFYNFIFLSRKWGTDKYRFKSALNHLKNPKDPMWLLIFPEGTNLSAVTRQKSEAWAKKTGLKDMKHQLLPRSTGLQFCLQELKQTTNWLYDCTIAYEGVPKGQYGQDIFTLRSSFFEGRPPKSVNMFWRRFKISDIPVDNDEAFGRWLNNRWREKDYILEYFYKFNQFPADDAVKALAAAEGKRKPNHAKMIGTEVKAGGWDEFLSIFGPITTAAGALSNVDMTESINFDALMTQVAKQQQLNLLNIGKAPLGAASQEAVRNALKAAQKSKALPQPVLNYLMKQTPQTQEQMKSALITSAKKSGNTQLAKKAAQAPADNKPVPKRTQMDVLQAAKQTQQMLAQSMSPKKNSIPNPAPSIQKAMPMANMNAVVTRPLSTMAMQTAAASVRNAAAQRTKEKGAALPGQVAAAKKTIPQANASKTTAPLKAASVASAPLSQKQPPKLGQSAGTRRQSVASLPATKKKVSTQHKPIGTQKYAASVKG